MRLLLARGAGAAGTVYATGAYDSISGNRTFNVPVANDDRADDLTLLLDQSDSFYFLGFNVRSASLSSSRFRNLLSHLVDRQHLVNTVFDGYATPAVSPLSGTGQVPEALQWEPGGSVTPFLGSDGELDTGQVRSAFREAGYRYDDAGTLRQS
jgi:peptide/nickel transport system substrate-binding protein